MEHRIYLVLLMCGNTMIPHRSSEYWRRGVRGVYDVRSIMTVIKKDQSKNY